MIAHYLLIKRPLQNPWAFFHLALCEVKPPWHRIFQSSMSRRPGYASSRNVTSVKFSIIALLKFFCLVTRAMRLRETIWNTGAKRLIFPSSDDPMAHGTGCMCSLGRNKARKSAQNCQILSSDRLFLRISPKYLGLGSLSLS